MQGDFLFPLYIGVIIKMQTSQKITCVWKGITI